MRPVLFVSCVSGEEERGPVMGLCFQLSKSRSLANAINRLQGFSCALWLLMF